MSHISNIYDGDKVVGQLRDSKGKYRKGRKWVKKCVIGLIGLSIAYLVGGYANTEVVVTIQDRIVEVGRKAPILDKIAQCESGNKHFDKNGQVMLRGNTNKSVDVGRYQINSVWFAKATELGLNLTNEEDNRKFAEWLYENRGTEDWKHSKNCWSK